MFFYIGTAVFFVVLWIVGMAFLWFSTPWGYQRGLYLRVIKRESFFDDPQVLRLVGLAGAIWAVIGGLNSGLHIVDEASRQMRVHKSVKMDALQRPLAMLAGASVAAYLRR